MNASSQQRLQDLESRFMGLEGKLKDTSEKEAISGPPCHDPGSSSGQLRPPSRRRLPEENNGPSIWRRSP